MTDFSEVPDAALVCEIDRRIQGESELHDHRNYLFRAALRPIYAFFDPQDIDEAHLTDAQNPELGPTRSRSRCGLALLSGRVIPAMRGRSRDPAD